MSDAGVNTEYIRPTWDEYFMTVMDAISKRATCGRVDQAVLLQEINNYWLPDMSVLQWV
ncbi:MAG: deoxycytidylate deaminase [Limisphaerales bacterium]|jgi:deoxycytidylate deaminase